MISSCISIRIILLTLYIRQRGRGLILQNGITIPKEPGRFELLFVCPWIVECVHFSYMHAGGTFCTSRQPNASGTKSLIGHCVLQQILTDAELLAALSCNKSAHQGWHTPSETFPSTDTRIIGQLSILHATWKDLTEPDCW